jgi:ATP/maltotriose-dependent transcriptional regulator MalT
MGDLSRTPDHHLQACQAALHRGAWAEARACFEAALQIEETPEALEGLGISAWGLNDAAAMFDAREQAYHLYRQRGDSRGAGRLAANLAMDHFYVRGEDAIANGWLQRARRLLAEMEPCPELGWLAVTEAQITMWVAHDPVAVQRLCAQAASLGKALGDLDLEMLALAVEGLVLVGQGDVSEGMRRLDEATLAASAGEMTAIDAACVTCCCLIFACEWTRDYGRAAQWIERLKELSARGSHPTQAYFCRTHYASLLMGQGAWAEAEAELEAAITELGASQPALAAEAMLRLAELRLRQGRFDEADALLTQAEQPPFKSLASDFCLLGRASMALAQNDAETAIDLAQRFLRAIPKENRMERLVGLELLILAQAARGDLVGATAALAEFRDATACITTKPVRAAVCFAEGAVALAGGDYEAARRCFEDAVDGWAASRAPYETALAQLELARALFALGRPQPAEGQARGALNVLQRLGAEPDAARAAAFMREIETTANPRGDQKAQAPDLPELTARELEILRLMAAGESNQDIAKRLVLSIRTVERHISNIYAKLGVSGASARAAVMAQAQRYGVVTSLTR